MKYFNTLPTITQKDINGNFITVSNIMSRCYFLPSLRNNLTLFYDYDIKEEDNIDVLSYRYYESSYRYWLILYANEVIDPFSSWVLNYNEFGRHLFSKYKEDASVYYGISNTEIQLYQVVDYTKLITHHYEEKITVTNDETRQVMKIIIDQETYNTSYNQTTTSYFGDGSKVTRETENYIVTIYDNEYNENEAKRKIKLINKNYVFEAESMFKDLMRS